jgi:hypothetical protein
MGAEKTSTVDRLLKVLHKPAGVSFEPVEEKWVSSREWRVTSLHTLQFFLFLHGIGLE